MSAALEKLFTSYQLGSLNLPNRIIRAAMYEPFCENGKISPTFTKLHLDYVNGGCGMTTTGLVTVDPEGAVSDHQLDMTANSVSELLEFTDSIHDIGGKVSLQFSFCGPYEYLYNPEDWFVMKYGVKELQDLKETFVKCAKQAEDGGFDAIEFHHFFLSQFLYPEMNDRVDEYGGSLENRVKFPVEIFQEIREVVSDDYPVFAKFTMNPSMSVDDYIYNAQALVNDGGVSSLVAFQTHGVEDFTELYCLENAIKVQNEVDVPVVYSGGVGDLDDLEVVMEHFDLVQVGRTILRDAQFPNKIKECVETESCLKCNKCHSFIWKEEDPDLNCIFRK